MRFLLFLGKTNLDFVLNLLGLVLGFPGLFLLGLFTLPFFFVCCSFLLLDLTFHPTCGHWGMWISFLPGGELIHFLQ